MRNVFGSISGILIIITIMVIGYLSFDRSRFSILLDRDFGALRDAVKMSPSPATPCSVLTLLNFSQRYGPRTAIMSETQLVQVIVDSSVVSGFIQGYWTAIETLVPRRVEFAGNIFGIARFSSSCAAVILSPETTGSQREDLVATLERTPYKTIFSQDVSELKACAPGGSVPCVEVSGTDSRIK